MNLSKRMTAVANSVIKGSSIADIGTDHGYIPIELAKNNMITKAIAMDINKGPLEKARKNIESNNLLGVIETRLSNGLEKLEENEVDIVIIAGMGGELINQILQEGEKKITHLKRLIVQPQTEIYKVRKRLHHIGYQIIDEIMVEEEGKYYFIILSEKGNEIYENPTYYYYGKHLIEKKDPIFKEYVEKGLEKNNQLLHRLIDQSPSAVDRIEAIKEEIKVMKEVLICL
ncbi:tRNA (adenine(22)-N(1))-methyltransferase [Natranaerovirga pectinivora]|nr:class I SAM-dependent methyltransferase [Natranaerovirga pectinivora]